jgi:hypothetical protein
MGEVTLGMLKKQFGLLVGSLLDFVANVLPDNRLKKKKPLIIKRLSEAFAVWTGLEPATPCVTGRYSNQLNYQTSLMRMQIYTE